MKAHRDGFCLEGCFAVAWLMVRWFVRLNLLIKVRQSL
jgi:hypothetical protein